MKKIAILLALFCLGLVTASLAVAKAPPGKGKPEHAGKKTTTSSTDPATCKPKISVILKGTFVSGGGTSFTMNVTQTNFHGRDLVGSPLTLTVDEKTKKPSATFEYQVVNTATNQSVLNVTENTDQMKNPGDQVTLAKSLPLAQLGPGVYQVTIKVSDLLSKQTISPTAKFAVE